MNIRKYNLRGKKYGRWSIVEKATGGWLCECSCGKKRIVKTNSLIAGKSLSCGCYLSERRGAGGKKNLKDLSGHRFGRLLVEELAHRDSRGEAMWLCSCECGQFMVVRGSHLREGSTTSCGCYRKELRSLKLIGHQYGRLTVHSRASKKDSNGNYYWNCTCMCGNKCVVKGSSLIGGITKSCGCLNDEKRRAQAFNIIGKRFGRLTVVKRLGSKAGSALWLSECDCGNFKECVTADLTRGNTTSCGCYNREQSSRAHSGAKNVNYNPDLTTADRLNKRDGVEHRNWSKTIFRRDNYTCKKCGSNRYLEAHHLNGWHWAKEERFSLDNGVTLCVDCHQAFHMTYGQKNNVVSQFLEFTS
jgi:hypothetical protein